MAYILRTHRDIDYRTMAHIAGICQPPPTSGEQMAEGDRLSLLHPGARLRRVVAEDDDSVIMGYTLTRLGGWIPEGQAFTRVYMDPAFRRQGVGHALLQESLHWIEAQGAHTVESICSGDDDKSLAWALRRGFVVARQRTEAVLDLDTFSCGDYADQVNRVLASGINLMTTGRPDEETVLRGLYQVETESWPDVPGFSGSIPEYGVWREQMLQGKNPLIYSLACDGPAVIGFSQLQVPAPGNYEAYTSFTAVRRAYRGRGIALALKIETIRKAKVMGLRSMRTTNDEDNPAILAVNRLLGYRSVPGPRVLKKVLGTT